MENVIQDYINDLRQSVTTAGLNYEIWWVYKDKDSRSKYHKAMIEYETFFITSIHAHFVAMLISLYRLYETRKDTVNIPGLLKLLKKHSKIGDDTYTRVQDIYDEAQPLWVKVSILRNEAFGHRTKKLDVSEVFDKAGVTPDELKSLIEKTKAILNELTHEWDRSVHAFNLGGAEDTKHLLNDLSELKETRSKNRFQPTQKERS